MREVFHQNLKIVSDQLVELTHLAGSAMSRATTALIDADLALAESVITADQRIDEVRAELDVARLRYPNSAVPAELRATIVEMGHIAEELVAKAGSVIASRDIVAAQELEHDDDAMDAKHRELFTRLADKWTHGTTAAVDITLLGRYYERFGDHAVSVASRVVYLVTGEWDLAVDHEDHEDLEDDLDLS